MTIHKYPVAFGEQAIQMPIGARLLAAQLQSATLCVWALVDPTMPAETRRIEVIGTGWEIDDSERIYLATVQIGPLVWHVFERL